MGVAEYLLHNRCDLNAFGGRDTLGDTLGDTLSKDPENPRAAYSEASRVRARGRGIRVLGAESEYAAAYSASLRVRASEASRRAA